MPSRHIKFVCSSRSLDREPVVGEVVFEEEFVGEADKLGESGKDGASYGLFGPRVE